MKWLLVTGPKQCCSPDFAPRLLTDALHDSCSARNTGGTQKLYSPFNIFPSAYYSKCRKKPLKWRQVFTVLPVSCAGGQSTKSVRCSSRKWRWRRGHSLDYVCSISCSYILVCAWHKHFFVDHTPKEITFALYTPRATVYIGLPFSRHFNGYWWRSPKMWFQRGLTCHLIVMMM